ncbi:hypothetical protein ASPZODRAFT_1305630 [Penicilliopsis zonata CBS 506.65]|uniref:Uncharacterized protein n=1 Tax=Penicilliopsis zonata CBS 506.65 TaxID=1073090 RepID=A0A1L9S5Z7_9EURO|nr:hypothetical protein ASPZODRAFT_1305630 [Penicilliopsis zonata CBS 506.65]OJJ42599.1 hypothetical protein ASPZODRAFT_1305630 [Penicilliopsis zonata CBS 506.65]
MPAHDSKIKQGRRGWEYKVTLKTDYDAHSMYSDIQLQHVRRGPSGDVAHSSDMSTGEVTYTWLDANGEPQSLDDQVDEIYDTYKHKCLLPVEGKVHSIKFHNIHVKGDDCVWNGADDGLEWTCFFD